jgi:hypothetical protein
MTQTYSNTLSSDKDLVRFEIGDVANFQLHDEEIDVKLAQSGGNVLLAAAECARALAARHAGEVDRIVGQSNVREGDRQKHYLDLAETLYQRAVVSAGRAYFGGYSVGDKENLEADTTRVAPRFIRGATL